MRVMPIGELCVLCGRGIFHLTVCCQGEKRIKKLHELASSSFRVLLKIKAKTLNTSAFQPRHPTQRIANMGTRKSSFYHFTGLLILIAFSGCASTNGGPFAWLSPKSGQNKAIEQMMAAQQGGGHRANQTSLYPPITAQKEPIPSKVEDLKNAPRLHLGYAKLQEQLGNLTESRLFYEKVITKEPRSVEANIGLARLEAIAGHNDQAEQRFRKSLEIAPNSPEALFAYGQFLASQKRYTESIVEMQKAVKQNPSSRYKFEIGLTLARSGQFDESYAALTNLIGEAEAYYNIGYIALKELNDPVVAERYLSLSLEVDPDLKQSRYWLTSIKSKQDRILTASGVRPDTSFRVKQAYNVQPASQRSTESRIPTTDAGSINLNNLTPEQWQQWKNQSEL